MRGKSRRGFTPHARGFPYHPKICSSPHLENLPPPNFYSPHSKLIRKVIRKSKTAAQKCKRKTVGRTQLVKIHNSLDSSRPYGLFENKKNRGL